jgi:tRNA modification GTPase
MSNRFPTTVAILTPTGRGAVAVIAVEGPQAGRFVEQFFQTQKLPSFSQRPVGRIVYGRWSSEPAEDVIVCRRREALVEVHCHGGRAAAQRIVDDLVAAGAEARLWSDWIEDHESSLIRAAARRALAGVATARTAEILLGQFYGALEGAVREVLATMDKGNGHWSTAREMIEKLLARAALGLHLAQPWRVVMAGPPNVGKSSLVNALVGYERAIVLDQPGTTRDVVTAMTALSGWPIEISDTAGWRASEEPLEAAGIERAQQQAATADCLLLVFDVSQPWAREQQELVDAWSQAIVVHNKCDLAAAYDPAGYTLAPVVTSAATGQGIDLLTQRIVQRLMPVDPEHGEAVPFTMEHVERLQGAATALKVGDDFAARAHLLALLAPEQAKNLSSENHSATG